MSPARVLLGMLLGLGAGLLAEFLDFVLKLTRDPEPGQQAVQQAFDWKYVGLSLIVGVLLGSALGIVEGLYSGSRGKFWRALAYGAFGGALCGYVGFGIGGYFYNVLGGDPTVQRTTAGFLQQMVARSVAWGVMGLLVGTVGGLPSLSFAKMRNGAIGGVIGGFLGGFIFQALGSMNVFYGVQLRLIGFGLTCASIGFFVGLVGEVFKQAWVKVLIGRNEGREHVLDGPVSVIGRNELVEIPVFLDPKLAARQASIRLQNGRYMLFDEAGRGDTRLRGQPVGPTGQVLTDGDVLQLGNVSLAFYEKATAGAGAGVRRSIPTAPPPSTVPIPRPGGGVCEFCGQTRDPQTGACACSVGGAQAPGYPSAPAYPGGAQGQPTQIYPPGAAYPPAGGPMAGDPAATAYAAPPYGGGTPFDPYMGGADQGSGGDWGQGGGYDEYGGQGGYATAQLVGIEGPYAGQAIPVANQIFTIGREQGRDLTIIDQAASRRHAAIYSEPSGYILRDEGSANGTYVNGMRVMEHVLYVGDEIRIGGSTFRFEA